MEKYYLDELDKQVLKDISYDGQKDGLFCAWYGEIKKQKGD